MYEGIAFVPVCQESLGVYHEGSASVLKKVALALDETETITHFFQKLSSIPNKTRGLKVDPRNQK